MNPWAPRNKLCSPVTLHSLSQGVTAPRARVPDPERIVLGQGVTPAMSAPVQSPILHPALSHFTTPLSCPKHTSGGSQPPQCSWTLLSPHLQGSPPAPGPRRCPLPVLPTQSTGCSPWGLDHPHPIPALALLSGEIWAALQGLLDTGMGLRDSDAPSAMGRLWNALHGRNSALERHRGHILGV